MRGHGLGARRGESHIDFPRFHKAEHGLNTLRDIGVADLRRIARVFPRELCFAVAFHVGVPGKTDKVLMGVDDHENASLAPSLRLLYCYPRQSTGLWTHRLRNY